MMPKPGPSSNTNAGAVSSLNLEPNPFEQSFASTKKNTLLTQQQNASIQSSIIKGNETRNSISPSNNSIDRKPSINSNYHYNQSPPPLIDRNSNNLNTLQQLKSTDSNNKNNGNNAQEATTTTTTTTTNTTTRPNILVPTFSSGFLFGSQRPNIQSPAVLTPGGSKKLPPLMLSPSFVTNNDDLNSNNNASNNHDNNNNSNSSSHTNPINNNSNNNNNINNNNSNNNNNNNNNNNGFLSYLPRTGLTPNDSNMRTGLTPGSLYPLLPSLGISNINNASNNNEKDNIASLIPTNNTNSNSMMNSNHENRKNSLRLGSTPSTSVLGTPAPFTPGISTLLGLTTNNNTPQYGNSISPSNKDGISSDKTTNNSNSNNGVGNVNSNSVNVKSDGLTTQILPINKNAINSDYGKVNTRKTSVSNSTKRTNKRKNSVEGDNESTGKYRKSSVTSSNEDNNGSMNKNEDFTTSPNTTTTTTATANPVDEQERKRKEFLERNRVAASKFRRRKKEYVQKIENDIKVYEREYDELSGILDTFCSFNGNRNDPSLLYLLQDSIAKNDVMGSLNIVNHIKQIITNTDYYRRHGMHPLHSASGSKQGSPSDSNAAVSNTTTATSAANNAASGSAKQETGLDAESLRIPAESQNNNRGMS